MRNTIQYEGVGRLFESYAFIESFGILLCLNIYECRAEMLYCSIYDMKHNLLAISFATHSQEFVQLVRSQFLERFFM